MWIEQPLPRAISFDPTATAPFATLGRSFGLIVDEADAGLEAFPRALQCGYGGISVKNCKGVFRGFVHRGLCELHAAHMLRPVPACSILQFEPALDKLRGRREVPRGSRVRSRPVRGTACDFQTAFDIDLLPLAITNQRLLDATARSPRIQLDFTLAPGGAAAVFADERQEALALTLEKRLERPVSVHGGRHLSGRARPCSHSARPGQVRARWSLAGDEQLECPVGELRALHGPPAQGVQLLTRLDRRQQSRHGARVELPHQVGADLPGVLELTFGPPGLTPGFCPASPSSRPI